MKFLDEITKRMEEAITLAKCEGSQAAYTTYNITNGYIDVWCDDKDDVEVVICQENKDKEYPLLEDAIFNAVPEWNSVIVEPDEDYNDTMHYGRI